MDSKTSGPDWAAYFARLDVEAFLRTHNIAYKVRGSKAEACCPLHDDRNPSFVIDLEDAGACKKGRWICHAGCSGTDGNSLLDLVIGMGLAQTIPEAKAYLGFAGSSPPSKVLPRDTKGPFLETIDDRPDISEEDMARMSEALQANTDALNYLTQERGLDPAIILTHRLGLCITRGKQWISLPQGKQIRLIAWPKDQPGNRFGWYHPKGNKTGFWPKPFPCEELFVVESELDCMLLASLGIAAVSAGGTSGFTVRRMRCLLDFAETVIACPDWDEPGQVVAHKMLHQLKTEPAPGLVVAANKVHGPGKDFGDVWADTRDARLIIDLAKQLRDSGMTTGSKGECPTSKLRLTDKGSVKACSHNVEAILREDSRWGENLWLNEMGRIPHLGERPLEDADYTRIVHQMCSTYGADFPVKKLVAAANLAATGNARHPVRDYLDGLAWDGTPRIDAIMGGIVQLEPKENRALKATYFRRWLVSAVARARNPGCKADCMLVLYSEGQGKHKTLFAEALGGAWYLDREIDPGSKDCAFDCHRAWIIEASELDATTRKKDMAHLRSYISRTTDTLRAHYGITSADYPRGFVFIGTTNDLGVVKEHDGRRYWPIAITDIDVEAFRLVRDQVWAEADHYYEAGEEWWLDDDENTARIKDTEETFQEGSSLNEAVVHFLGTQIYGARIPITDVTEFLRDRGVNYLATKLRDAMRKAGWEYHRSMENRRWRKASCSEEGDIEGMPSG